MALPTWLKPQLTKLVDRPPDGPDWLHEIKFDGYRMHARLDRGAVRLLTRAGLDWTHKYPAIASALSSLPAKQAYLDGETVRHPAGRLDILQPDRQNADGFAIEVKQIEQEKDKRVAVSGVRCVRRRPRRP